MDLKDFTVVYNFRSGVAIADFCTYDEALKFYSRHGGHIYKKMFNPNFRVEWIKIL